ncbi:hypothetical protein OH407_23835, partial [Salmonella enterica]
MALPALWMIRGGGDQVAGESGGWALVYKARWLLTLLQERWLAWDAAAMVVLLLFGYAVLRSRR